MLDLFAMKDEKFISFEYSIIALIMDILLNGLSIGF